MHCEWSSRSWRWWGLCSHLPSSTPAGNSMGIGKTRIPRTLSKAKTAKYWGKALNRSPSIRKPSPSNFALSPVWTTLPPSTLHALPSTPAYSICVVSYSGKTKKSSVSYSAITTVLCPPPWKSPLPRRSRWLLWEWGTGGNGRGKEPLRNVGTGSWRLWRTDHLSSSRPI